MAKPSAFQCYYCIQQHLTICNARWHSKTAHILGEFHSKCAPFGHLKWGSTDALLSSGKAQPLSLLILTPHKPIQTNPTALPMPTMAMAMAERT
jgi:hypothetical protein